MTRKEMQDDGCPEIAVPACERACACGVDWGKIMGLVAKFGPVIWQIIQEMFASPQQAGPSGAKPAGDAAARRTP